MRYLSLFSGMEAAHLAWHPLGWQCVGVAEIEPAACALLRHRLPNVPNLGSVTDITADAIRNLGRIDVVIGGSPCQDLSVAGKRAGLAGARSGLFHEQLRIFDAARHFCGARWLVWENVPGAFSSNKGRDFAVVAGALAGCELDVPADGWGSEGVALGENGLVEWAVLDAQWFGVARRRRRVFAVLDTGDWASRSPVLLERDSLRGDSAPRREAGEGVTGTLSARTQGGGGLGTDFEVGGGLIPSAVMAHGQGGAEITAGERSPTLTCNHEAPILIQEVAHTLSAGHGNIRADGTGRGTPIVPEAEPYTLAIRGRGDDSVLEYRQDGTANTLLTPSGGRGGINVGAVAFDTTQITSSANYSNPKPGDPCHPLAANAHPPAVAFGCKDSDPARSVSDDVSPTLRAMGHADSHANAGGQVAVAYTTKLSNTASNNAGKLFRERTTCLDASSPPPALLTPTQVRRLTPEECEALQGAPRGWTLVPNERGKPMADGARYRMLGNSFAVPVIRWIGAQIERASAAKLQVAA